jgi:hypothetical protein
MTVLINPFTISFAFIALMVTLNLINQNRGNSRKHPTNHQHSECGCRRHLPGKGAHGREPFIKIAEEQAN